MIFHPRLFATKFTVSSTAIVIAVIFGAPSWALAFIPVLAAAFALITLMSTF